MSIKDLAYYQKLIETRSYTKTAKFFQIKPALYFSSR
jgi:hypothetical protein